jgi:uroporphyrinogen decarboxylase
MMTFAAHYVGQPLSRYYQDHRVLVEANLAMVEDFELDIVQAISDPYREAADWGADILFPEDGLPICRTPLLDSPGKLDEFPSPDPHTGRRMSDRLAAISSMREQVGGEVPVMGWVEGPLAEAADLRGVNNLLLDLYDRPDFVKDLLDRCLDVAIAFAKAQIDAGADIIGLGDAVASQISPRMYRRWAQPYEERIFDVVRDQGKLSRLHICGDTGRILKEMAATSADIIDVDWMVDFGEAAEIFRARQTGNGGPAAICGNFDPVAVILQGTPEEVYTATIGCLKEGGPRSFSAAGCEIPDGTPLANLRAQTQALHDFDGN